jgi:hypothetical protein
MSNSDIEAKIEALPPNEDLKFLNRVSGYYKKSDLTTDDLKTLVSQLSIAKEALEHYGDKKNWEPVPNKDFDPEMYDWYRPDDVKIFQRTEHGYDFARAALDRLEKEKAK